MKKYYRKYKIKPDRYAYLQKKYMKFIQEINNILNVHACSVLYANKKRINFTVFHNHAMQLCQYILLRPALQDIFTYKQICIRESNEQFYEYTLFIDKYPLDVVLSTLRLYGRVR